MTHIVVGHGRAGAVVLCVCGAALLQPDVSRRSTAEGECVTGSWRPATAGACGMPHPPPRPRPSRGRPLPWARPAGRGQERSVGTMEGRTALVTGGSRGIGLAIAQSLVDRGARVVLTARKPEALAEAVESLGGPERGGRRGGARRRRRTPRGGRADGDRDLRQPGHAGRQRRGEPRLRPDGRPRPRRLPQDPRHQRRLLPRPGAGGLARAGWPSTAGRCCSSRRWPGSGRRRTSARTA